MSDLERWQTRFSAPDYVFGKEPNAFLKSQAALLPRSGRALSAADGEGRNGVWLAGQGLEVVSVDFSSAGQEKARRLAAERGVSIATVHADLATWTFPAAEFDVAVAIFIQFCGPDIRARVFEGLRRALKPRGLLLVQGYRPKQLEYKTGGPSQVENLYTADLLRKSFGDWEIVTLREHDSVIDEGSGHGGMSALVDLVARKPG
jgi:SAM-dependent methyltransferase